MKKKWLYLLPRVAQRMRAPRLSTTLTVAIGEIFGSDYYAESYEVTKRLTEAIPMNFF
jgi:hypothetical protein